MMVATPPTPPVAPETRTGPLSGLTPPLSIACFGVINHKSKSERCVCQQCLIRSDLNAKHGGVSCGSNLGGVFGRHSFRQRDRPVSPGSRTSRVGIWKQTSKGQTKDMMFDQVYIDPMPSKLHCMLIFSPDACLACIAPPVVRSNAPAVHHHRVAHSEEHVENSNESYL